MITKALSHLSMLMFHTLRGRHSTDGHAVINKVVTPSTTNRQAARRKKRQLTRKEMQKASRKANRH